MGEIFQIYLAGGCLNEDDEGRGWREKATEIFKQAADSSPYQVRVFNPIDFFSYSEAKHQSDKQVKWYYMDQIKNSRVVLVNLNNSNKSIGTGQELQYAYDNGIPIIGFGETEVYPWLKVDCQCIFSSLLST